MNIICDTSVIINFLNISRLDLLVRYSHTFWITEHVHKEITLDYPAQQQLLQNALENLTIQKTAEGSEELELFINLIKSGQLGSGECSSIAVAAHRGYFLAIDDNKAIKKAELLISPKMIFRTQDILVGMIKEDLLDFEAADQLLQSWATFHRFKLKIPTIKNLFSKDNLLQESSSEWNNGIFPFILSSV